MTPERKEKQLDRLLGAMDRFVYSKIEDHENQAADYIGDTAAVKELREAFNALLLSEALDASDTHADGFGG